MQNQKTDEQRVQEIRYYEEKVTKLKNIYMQTNAEYNAQKKSFLQTQEELKAEGVDPEKAEEHIERKRAEVDANLNEIKELLSDLKELESLMI